MHTPHKNTPLAIAFKRNVMQIHISINGTGKGNIFMFILVHNL